MKQERHKISEASAFSVSHMGLSPTYSENSGARDSPSRIWQKDQFMFSTGFFIEGFSLVLLEVIPVLFIQ